MDNEPLDQNEAKFSGADAASELITEVPEAIRNSTGAAEMPQFEKPDGPPYLERDFTKDFQPGKIVAVKRHADDGKPERMEYDWKVVAQNDEQGTVRVEAGDGSSYKDVKIEHLQAYQPRYEVGQVIAMTQGGTAETWRVASKTGNWYTLNPTSGEARTTAATGAELKIYENLAAQQPG